MKDFLFSMALGCAVGGLVLSICNLVADVVYYIREYWEKKNKNP